MFRFWLQVFATVGIGLVLTALASFVIPAISVWMSREYILTVFCVSVIIWGIDYWVERE